MLLIMLGIGAAVSGCTTTKTVTVSAASAIRPAYEHGLAVLRSQKKNRVVVILLKQPFSEATPALPAFVVEVDNLGAAKLDFSPGNITAYCGDTPVRLYRFEELLQAMQSDAQLDALSVRAELDPETDAASRDPAPFWITPGTPYIPAPGAGRRAQIEADSGTQRIAALNQDQIWTLRNMLRRRTIAPGTGGGGVVRLHGENLQSGQRLRLLVAVGGEVHEFLFDIGT